MASKTFLQLYTDALTVADELSGSGSAVAKTIIKAGINESYADIASVRNWKTLENTGTVPTVAGTFEYTPITSSASIPRIRRIQSVLDETNSKFIQEVKREDFEQKFPYVDTNTQGTSYLWFESGYTAGRDMKIKVYPVPSGVATLRLYWYEEPLELSDDSSIPRIPDQFHYGLTYLGLAKYYEFQKDPIATYYRNLHTDYKQKILTGEYDITDEMPSMGVQQQRSPLVIGKIGRVYN